MKKAGVLICCFLVLLTGCTYDPYSDQRPFDYGESKWICDEYDIWFYINPEKEDYYYPEGELRLEGNEYFCKFYFIHQTNQVAISVYPLEYAAIPSAERDCNSTLAELHGDCSFSEEFFTLFVDSERDTIFHGKVEKLTFFRREYTN